LVLRYFRHLDWLLALACLAFVVSQVYLDLRIPEYMEEITNHMQISSSTDVVAKVAADMLFCTALSFGCAQGVGFIAARIGASLGNRLRSMQFDKVGAFSEGDVSRFTAASLITRSTNDVSQVQLFVSRALVQFIKAPIMATWAILKILGHSWEFTLVTAITVAVMMAITVTVLSLVTRYFRRIQWLTDKVNLELRENLDGMRTVRSSNAEVFRMGRFDSANGNLLDNNLTVARYMSLLAVNSTMLSFLMLAIYWVGAGIIMSQPLPADQMQTFSDTIVFSSYGGQVLMMFGLMTEMARMFPRALVSMRRIGEVLDFQPSVVSGASSDVGKVENIEFKDVSFAYPGSARNAVEGISFGLRRGHTLAIIGPTGSGKTTLVNLLCRLYDPVSGRVLVNGTDIRDLDIQDLRRHMGVVPQKQNLFSGSIGSNVNFGEGSEERTEEDVWKALEIAQATEFVRSREGGLDSPVSQRGENLSGGQRQRIAIARALIRRPEVYVMDDCLSALDFRTERLFLDAFRKESEGSMVVIVSQRVGTVMHADQILVMEDGRIVGKGTHEELMRDCPLYREISQSQAMGAD
jgi:ATP-binding cassette subfamily B protein